MKLAIRLSPGAESLLLTANSYQKNLSKNHQDMFTEAITEAIRPLRSSAKAKMMLGGILEKSPRKSSPKRK